MGLGFFVELSCANNKEWIVDGQPTVHQQWSPLSSLITLIDLVIRGSLVQFPAGALLSVLVQDSLFHIASVYPAAKWVPSINKAVLRACALYAARGVEVVSVCTGQLGEEGRVSASVDTRLQTEYLYLYLYVVGHVHQLFSLTCLT